MRGILIYMLQWAAVTTATVVRWRPVRTETQPPQPNNHFHIPELWISATSNKVALFPCSWTVISDSFHTWWLYSPYWYLNFREVFVPWSLMTARANRLQSHGDKFSLASGLECAAQRSWAQPGFICSGAANEVYGVCAQRDLAFIHH